MNFSTLLSLLLLIVKEITLTSSSPLLLPPPTSPSASSSTISNTQEDTERDARALHLALDTWQTSRECHPAFFERTPANLAASNHARYYREWHRGVLTSDSTTSTTNPSASMESGEEMDGMSKSNLTSSSFPFHNPSTSSPSSSTSSVSSSSASNPNEKEKVKKISTYRLFARQHWGSLDFDCKAQFNSGCHVVPECATIVTATIERERRKGKRPEECLRTARTVYFVMQSFVYGNWDLWGRAESLKAIESSVIVSVDGIVKSFAQQVDPRIDFYCAATLQSVDMVLGFLSKLFSLSSDEHAQPVVDWTAYFINTVKAINTLSVQGKRVRNPNSHGSVVHEYEIHLTPQYADNWCSNFGGGRTNNNEKHTAGLRVHLDRIFKDFRKAIYATSDIMAFSDEYDNWIEEPLFEDTSKTMNSQKIAYEEQATIKIQDWALSAVFNGAQCYQKCFLGGYTDGSCRTLRSDQSRYCPREKELCQLACWSTIGKGPFNSMIRNHEVGLYGLENLEKYGYTTAAIQRASYANYLAHGNSRTLDTLQKDIDNAEIKHSLNLNVCRSTRVQVVRLRGGKNDHLHWQRNKRLFPCSCGDWRSNETAGFMDKMGFNPKSGRSRMELAKGLFEHVCPKQFQTQELSPVESFLALCALSIRFPRPNERRRKRMVIGERNPFCDTVFKRLEGRSLTEGNRYFCNWFYLDNPVFETEKRKFIYNGVTYRNHQWQCFQWRMRYPEHRGTSFYVKRLVDSGVKRLELSSGRVVGRDWVF